MAKANKATLTTRQYRLHDLIKSGNGKRFTKREIYEAVPGYEWHEDASDKCPSIRTDMLAINSSGLLDAVIVFDHQEYYWATEDQIIEFIQRKRKTIATCAREIYALTKKLRANRQGKLINNQLNELKPTDKQFHETAREE